MADDIQQVADQGEVVDNDAEMDAAFDKTAAGEQVAPENKADPEKKQEPAKVDPVKAGEPEKKAEPELSDAQKALAERAKKFDEPAPGGEPEKKTEPEKKVEPEKKAGDPAAVALPADVEAALKLPGVADAKINVDGVPSTMAEFAKQYPEIVESGLIIARAIAQAQSAESLKAAGLDGFAKSESVGELNAKIARFELMVGVMSGGHPDCVKIANSPEWDAWMKTLPPGQQKMESSLDPADHIALLDAFKEQKAREAGDKAKDKAKDAKAKKDAMHADSLSGKQRPSGEGAESGQDDEFERAFDRSAGKKG